jgi:hypothetical protein
MGVRRSTPDETRRALAALLGGGRVAVTQRQDGKIELVEPPPSDTPEPDPAPDGGQHDVTPPPPD